MYTRFMTVRKEMSHETLQEYTVIDYTKEMVILATVEKEGQEFVVGLAEYYLDEESLGANVAFTVRDEYQNKGVGTELLQYLVYLAKREGLHTLTAEVLVENKPMMRVFQKLKLPMEVTTGDEVHELVIRLK